MSLVTRKYQHWLYPLLVLVLAYCTYVHNFWSPPYLFWDENYHITSAQKYMNEIYFMEPHPPLGKLLIAAGEELLDRNEEDNQFITTDYGRKLPPGYDFTGYRLFPVLLGWLTALVLYYIFLVLTKRRLFSALLTFPYIFDNAQIVHSRGAMLDSTMTFLAVVLILLFLLLLQYKEHPKKFAINSLLFGVAFGCILGTKALGLIMILLIPALFVGLYPRWRTMGTFTLYCFIGFFVSYVTIWQIHFSLGRTIQEELPDNGYYQASEEYKAILDAGHTGSPFAFYVQWRDSMKFLSHYSKGVPELNLCKPVENGSPSFMWPIGARTISYRWESPDNVHYRYLYNVPNPIGWWSGLLAVFVAGGLLLASVTLPLRQPLRNPFYLLVFFGLYVSYMIAISQLDRVMYLYHYFLPLMFAYILIGLVLLEIQTIGRWKLTESTKTIGLLTFGVLVFCVFQWFRPLTYYIPLDDDQFDSRRWVRLWDMRCAHCKRDSALVKPTS